MKSKSDLHKQLLEQARQHRRAQILAVSFLRNEDYVFHRKAAEQAEQQLRELGHNPWAYQVGMGALAAGMSPTLKKQWGPA